MRCISPISVKDPRKNRGSIRLIVPCGRCGACLSNRRAQWSFRLLEEFNNSTSAVFVTLTYNKKQVPKSNKGILSLRKRDYQLFIKKLRKKINVKIRYYTVGEYGSKTFRPHYHAIIFNGGISINTHLQTCWTDGKSATLGAVNCGDVNGASIHYITKYHVNYIPKGEWEELGLDIEPEFATMSRNPGIGHQYVSRAGTWNRSNRNQYVVNKGFKQALPRYYKNKLFTSMQKEILAIEGIKMADKAYIKEVERLMRLKYKNPTFEIEKRQYSQSEKVIKKAKADGKI